MSKKHYFDNEKITELLNEYNRILRETGEDRKDLLYPFTKQIEQLVKGVINTHKIYRWWSDIDELVQEGMAAIYASFDRYDPEKGTAFNYFSIVAKQHLKNWTQQRNKKNFITFEYNDAIYDIGNRSDICDTVAIKHLLMDVDVPNYLEDVLVAICDVIVDHRVYNKRDIIKYLSRKGYNKKDVHGVFAILEEHFNNGKSD